MGYPDIWGINKGSIFLDKENRAIRRDWEVAGFAEDSEIEYDRLKNAKMDLEEAGLETKIEKSSFGYVLYAR